MKHAEKTEHNKKTKYFYEKLGGLIFYIHNTENNNILGMKIGYPSSLAARSKNKYHKSENLIAVGYF